MKRNLMALVALVSLFLAGSLVTGQTAAQAYPSDCPSGQYICFYDNANGTGLLSYSYYSVYPKSQCEKLVSSEYPTSFIANRSSYRYVVYTDAYCLDNPGVIYANSQGSMNSTYSNKIRSMFRAT